MPVVVVAEFGAALLAQVALEAVVMGLLHQRLQQQGELELLIPAEAEAEEVQIRPEILGLAAVVAAPALSF